MSKFIDRLNRVTHSAPQPIGFRASRTAAAPVIQLVVRLTTDADPSPGRLKGADAALAPVTAITSGATRLKKLAKDAPDIIWGASLEERSRDDLEKTSNLGADFVIFPAAGTPVSVPPEDGAGVILQIEASISDTVLRTVNDTPVDAVLVGDEERGEGPLTWAGMLRLQRVAKLLSLPLLVAVPATVAVDELRVLSEAGIAGIVVDLGGKEAVDLLSSLRKTIDGLPAPVRKRRHTEAVVPHVAPEAAAAAAEEEEEEDDEDFD